MAIGTATAEADDAPAKMDKAECDRVIAALYEEHIDRLRAYVTSMLKSPADAEEIAHDAFIRLYRSELSAYNDPAAVLFKTAWRLALNKLRARRSNPLDHADYLIEELSNARCESDPVEETIIEREKVGAYRQALNSLPPRCRQVMELRTVHELSYREMSDRLGLSVSTLEKHIVKGKKACIDMLSDWRGVESQPGMVPSPAHAA